MKKIDRRIFNLKELETLDMSDNQITTLENCSLQSLPKIKQLNLSNNEIKYVPPSFLKSTSLAILDLSHNEVTKMIYCYWKFAVQLSCLYPFQLVCIPSNISRLPRLQILKINNNAIRRIPHVISKLQSLR